MITIYAGQEGSQVADSQYGKPIFISTTARILFRAANPDYKKQRNDVLNKLIANLFSTAKIDGQNFKPKGGGNAMGEFRSLGAMRFVAIIDTANIRVISVKGSIARLPAVSPKPTMAPTVPPAGKTSSLNKMAGFESFVCDHLSEFAKKRFKLSDNAYARLESFLLPIYDNNRTKMLKSLCNRENESDIHQFLNEKMRRDEANHYNLQDHGLHDAYNIMHQL